jgi:hypothetical protein
MTAPPPPETSSDEVSAPPVDTGFACPVCASPTRVVVTRRREGGRRIVRSRKCQHRHCGVSVTTIELLAVRLAELTGDGPLVDATPKTAPNPGP